MDEDFHALDTSVVDCVVAIAKGADCRNQAVENCPFMLLPVDVKVHDTHFGGGNESKTDDIQGKLGKEDRKPIEALGEVGVEEIGVP